MIRVRDEGAEQFIKGLDDAAPRRELFVLQFGNAVDYAVYLQERHGYFVIDDEHLLDTVASFLARAMQTDRDLTDADVERALEDASTEEVRYLQAFIGQMRPPIQSERQVKFTTRGGDTVEFTAWRGVSGKQRPARRGNWADRTTSLANGFYARVGLRPLKRFPVPAIPYVGSPKTVHPRV